MIFLIPVISNDCLLTGTYILIIVISFLIKYEKRDYLFFIFGLVAMTIAEVFFILTGVEEFIRKDLFGIIPLWLPILWAYSFVAIKRGIMIINKR